MSQLSNYVDKDHTLSPTELHHILIDELGVNYNTNTVRLEATLKQYEPKHRIMVFLSVITIAHSDSVVESRFLSPRVILSTLGISIGTGYTIIRKLKEDGALTRQEKKYAINLSDPEAVWDALPTC